ncbi:MAG: hypothetical protein OER88_12545, partial [Planctomycetota bacterium]|nr:hypothetical protein [Planctomycetota bacterium]
AIAEYLEALTGDGLLCFQVTNWYLDLPPVLAAAALDLGLVAYERRGPAEALTAHWVALGRRAQDLARLAERGWTPVAPRPGFQTWTDDYSNILSVLK